MRIQAPNLGPTCAKRGLSAGRAFTLPEVMTTMAIFFVVMAGVIASHLFGLRMYQVTTPKLGASDEARAAVSKLINDIRSARLVRIGDGGLGSFTEVGIDSPQKGSAIQVYPSFNTNYYTRYFWDASDKKLKVTTNGATAVQVVANCVSNQLVFTAEDYAGNILTNNHNNRVIGLLLEFYQVQYPRMSVGPGNYYDYYRLRTRITRRTIL
jgi:hypothetical protein